MAIELPDTAVKDLFRRRQNAGFTPRAPIKQQEVPPEKAGQPRIRPPRRIVQAAGHKARVQVYVSHDEYKQVITSRATYPSYSAYIEDALGEHMRAAAGSVEVLFGGHPTTASQHCLNLRLSPESVVKMRSCIQHALISSQAQKGMITISGLIRSAIRADMTPVRGAAPEA
ncbi:MAG: hypothetical protein E7001_00465 [Coriobacteriaceae bacterium]|nr:hypothetical protein [Coriobacteriaceae bacterium]